MSYDSKLCSQYQCIKGMYDANFNNPTQGVYNAIKGSVYELKSTNLLPQNMYDSVNKMQNNFGNQLGGLENKLNNY